MTPRTIWFYWHQGIDNAPPLVQMCHWSWVAKNPEWDVRILDWRSLPVQTAHVAHAGRQAVSDLIRINLLSHLGGVWVDASCFCVEPLDEWLGQHIGTSGFFAFSDPGRDRMVASWFLAAAPDSYIATQWARAANTYWERPPSIMAKPVRLTSRLTERWPDLWFTGPARWLGLYPYYWFHYLFGRLYRSDKLFRTTWDWSPRVSASLPHAAIHKGLGSPVDEEFREHVDQRLAPLYKLNWREDHSAAPGTVLHHLYQTLDVRVPEHQLALPCPEDSMAPSTGLEPASFPRRPTELPCPNSGN